MRVITMVVMMVALSAAAPVPTPTRPLIIAHRGASGERPEHTQAAYELAIDQGADYIEPDLVLTKDGALVDRHENEISGTTNVASHPEFAARKATKVVDGESVTGWFTENFTLAELKTLRARERLPQLRPDSAKYDGQFAVMTLDEIIALVRAREKATKRRIGIYPETKHPSYFAKLGLSFDKALLQTLKRGGYSKATDPIFIQSFEVGNLKRLRTQTQIRLIQLMSDEGGPADSVGTRYASMATPAGLRTIATYANGVGVAKAMILPLDKVQQWAAPTSLITDAHAAGLKVHVWTFRAENVFLPLALRSGPAPGAHGDLDAEIKAFVALGIDGLFSDFPSEAVAAVR
jgi:glycerophosphoryl diester phosphodiesterase